MILEIFWRFVLVGMLAFGGGSAALPLVERIAVAETGWVSSQDFATAVAFGYVTPGPVLITGTFIGYKAAGIAGALVATAGVFLVPWALAGAAAQTLRRFVQHPRLEGFGRGASPAVVGLLGVTAYSLGRSALVEWPYALIAASALFLGLKTRVNPILIILGGAVCGVGLDVLPLG